MSDHTCSFFTCSAASTLAAAGAGGPSSSELPSKLPMIGSSLRRLFSSLNDMIMSTTGSAVQRLDLLAMLRYESDVMNLVCKSALINTIYRCSCLCRDFIIEAGLLVLILPARACPSERMYVPVLARSSYTRPSEHAQTIQSAITC